MEFGFGRDLFHALEMCRGRSCDENIVVVLVHGFDDPCDLIDRLAAAEDDFRKALAADERW